jgi:hypothetical protein
MFRYPIWQSKGNFVVQTLTQNQNIGKRQQNKHKTKQTTTSVNKLINVSASYKVEVMGFVYFQ